MASRISPYVDNTGLVFHYDTGNTVRSYLGEPTTNVYGNWVQYTANSYEVLDNSTNYVKLLASAGTPWSGRFEATVSTGTYTVSFQHRTDNSNTTSFVIDNDAQDDNIWNATVSTTAEWQTYTSTKTHTGTGNHLLYFRRNGGDGNVYIRNVQLELKSHATPFIKGTRSATQGLKDLAGNSTIDLTNVSFDSNAQMTFDGTNDLITLTDAAHLKFSNGSFTIEQVLSINSISSKQRTFSKGSSGWSRGWHAAARPTQWEFELSDGVSTPGNSFLINTATTVGTNHVVWVIESAVTAKLYVNGVQVGSTQTITESVDFATTTSTVGIGAFESGGEYFNGRIPYTRLYARALSASEIQQNFNAIKGRYGL